MLLATKKKSKMELVLSGTNIAAFRVYNNNVE